MFCVWAHLVWDQGVAGSNPVFPTKQDNLGESQGFFVHERESLLSRVSAQKNPRRRSLQGCEVSAPPTWRIAAGNPVCVPALMYRVRHYTLRLNTHHWPAPHLKDCRRQSCLSVPAMKSRVRHYTLRLYTHHWPAPLLEGSPQAILQVLHERESLLSRVSAQKTP